MTPNTSPKKPAWFVLIESDAPSAQVRKVDKKLPAATAFAALAIVASGTFFASGSSTSESPATSTLASSAGTNPVNNSATDRVNDGVNDGVNVTSAKLAAPQAVNAIADPSLNGGGDDDGDHDGDDDDYDDDDNREDDDDDDRGDDEEDDD